MSEKLLRISAVVEATGISRSLIYQKIKAGKFPAPIRIDEETRVAVWPSSAIDAWISATINNAIKETSK